MQELGLDCPAYHDAKVLALEEQSDWEDTSGPHTKEQDARLSEETRNAQSRRHWTDQEMLTRLRIGRVMGLGELLRVLRKAAPGIVAAERGAAGMVGLSCHGKYICAAPPGLMPEFSELAVDAWGVPTKERKRGWRTVLLNMIERGAVTEEQVKRLFGRPEHPMAETYRRRLQELRALRGTA